MSRIKECFTSRLGKDGIIMEADFSQLEVVGLALISGDEQLKKDLLNGVDFHAQTASWLFNIDYDRIMQGVADGDKHYKALRQSAKEPNFLNQYGGGAPLMASRTGLTKSQCQKFIDEYYTRYSGVKSFQDSVIEEVQNSRVPTSKRDTFGTPLHKGFYTSITGRRYVFTEYDNSTKYHKEPSFSPTEMKNYPIQGFATGDIVPEVLGRIYRAIRNSDVLDESCKLIGTVHDSIVFDVHKRLTETAKSVIIQTMEDTPIWMKDRFGIDLDLPFKADIAYGSTWAETK